MFFESSSQVKKLVWGAVANILFLESPAGVGFSYTSTSSNLEDSGDDRTAEDALIFLRRWMDRFPQYKSREFYLAGESYAGHYVPQLANKIYDYNNHSSQPIINLKGFIVGNADTDSVYDYIGTVNYWWSHALISDHTYNSLLKLCNNSFKSTSPKCVEILIYADQEIGKINQYNIYTEACSVTTQAGGGRSKHFLHHRRVAQSTTTGFDPCTESYAEIYYNRPDVQKALHANTTTIPYKWTACSDTLYNNWKDAPASMLPVYTKLIGAGLRIWVFSGDADAIVPITATRLSLSHLNLKIKTPCCLVGGWTEVYDGLTFATVRGDGHEVPLTQPARAFKVIESFLSGKELPKSE